jgi:hypothetical protein
MSPFDPNLSPYRTKVKIYFVNYISYLLPELGNIKIEFISISIIRFELAGIP